MESRTVVHNWKGENGLDKEVMKNSLGQIEGALDHARDALRQLEHEHIGVPSGGGYAYPEGALAGFLTEAYELITFAFEASGLESPLPRLRETWAKFRKKGLEAAGETRWDSFESEPLNCLTRMVQGMRGAVGEGPNSADAFGLNKLESILRDTGVLVRRRGVDPTKEADIQHVMHDYLGAFFDDYSTEIKLPTPIKTFEPDGGVPTLKAAIEFKFATSLKEVKQEVDGIYADMIGYSGSEDWNQFFSVMYQTDAFVSEGAYKAAVFRGGRKWTPIIVVATGERKPRAAKAADLMPKMPRSSRKGQR